MKRFLWLGFMLFLDLICTGCGDSFRPIIIPNPPTFPNPAAAHSVVAISDNGTTVAGSVMVIDVSGDSIASAADCTTPLCIGIAPVHAVQQTASQALVVNQSDSISKVNFSNLTTIASTTTITLPANSAPNFVAVAPNQTTAYVTLPKLNEVGVVNTSNGVTSTIAVGNTPVALAVTPDNSKLYVANQGDSTISAFNTLGQSARIICVNAVCPAPPANTPIPLSSPPIWLVARTDGQRVYALEQTSGTLASIDTTSTAGPDTLTETSISVPGAVKMVYDGNKNRLYIPGGSTVTIVDVSQAAPSTIATLAITPTTPSGCSPIGTATLSSVDVAALPDGTRAYVGSFYEDPSGKFCPQVTVIDAVSNTVKTFLAVPGFPAFDAFCATTRFRIMMAAGGDSSRAYLSSCDGGNVNIIDTSNDTYIESLTVPASSRMNNPPQNPVFLFAGP
jgi:lactonase family protein with 7-bladed beta-propeller